MSHFENKQKENWTEESKKCKNKRKKENHHQNRIHLNIWFYVEEFIINCPHKYVYHTHTHTSGSRQPTKQKQYTMIKKSFQLIDDD